MKKKNQNINTSGIWHFGSVNVASKSEIGVFAIFNIESPRYFNKLVKEIKRRVVLEEVIDKEKDSIFGIIGFEDERYLIENHTYEDKYQTINFYIEEKTGKYYFTFDFNNYKLSGGIVGDKSNMIKVLDSKPEEISLTLTTSIFDVIHYFDINNVKFFSKQNKASLH
jgi:hypothetical protein